MTNSEKFQEKAWPFCGEILDLSVGKKLDQLELFEEVQKKKVVLSSNHLLKGDRVLIKHGNSIQFFIDLFAIWSLDACAVPIDPNSTSNEMAHILERSDCKLILGKESLEVRESNGLEKAPGCLILYTSGTSGEPKGVLHSFSGLFSRFKAWENQIEDSELTNTLCVLPTHFGHGLLANCLFPLFRGAKLHLTRPFDFNVISRLGQLIDDHEITFLSTVPTIWEMARRFSSPPKKTSLRRVHCASAPLSLELWKDIQKWAGENTRVFNVYGLTETASWVAGYDLSTGPVENGLVGLPWGCQFEIRGKEVYIKSESLMIGYDQQVALTNESILEGWFRTGDLGYLDPKGRLVLTGRIKTQINRAGIKVSPEEIGFVLDTHPAVQESVAFALPDSLTGEAVAVAIVFASNDSQPSFSSLEAWLRERLAPHKVPSRWFEIKAIPRNSRGKVDRATLAKTYQGQEEV